MDTREHESIPRRSAPARVFALALFLATWRGDVPLLAQDQQPPAAPPRIQRMELAQEVQAVFAWAAADKGKHELVVQQDSTLVFFSTDTNGETKGRMAKVRAVQLPEETLLYGFCEVAGKARGKLLTVSPSEVISWDFVHVCDDMGGELEFMRHRVWALDSPFSAGRAGLDTHALKWPLFAQMQKDEAGPATVVPARSGWTILRESDKESFVPSASINLAPSASQSVEWGLHGRISCRTTLPSPFPGDFDGDGRTDVAFVVGARLLVFLQAKDGNFPEQPANVVELRPLAGLADGTNDAQKAGWILGAAVRPLIHDLNSDGRSDVLLEFPYDGSVAIHLAQVDGKFADSPDRVLRVDGWIAKAWLQFAPKCPPTEKSAGAAAPSLLLAICPKLGLWAGVQAAASKQVPVRLESRAFDEKGIPLDSPSWQRAIQAPIEMSVVGWSKVVEFGAMIAINADLIGDAFPDLLLKADKDELLVFQGQHEGAYSQEPVRTIPVPELKGFIVKGGIEPVVADFDGNGRDDVAFLGSNVQTRKSSLFVLFGER